MLDRSIAEAAAQGMTGEEGAVLVLREVERWHPTLVYLTPRNAGGAHVATWMEDDGPKRATRDTAEQLARAVLARFGSPKAPAGQVDGKGGA